MLSYSRHNRVIELAKTMLQIKKQIPNLLTLGNLICGTLIIICAFQLQFVHVAYLAVLSLVFDFLDGTAARLLKVSSTIGKELDSMADMVSFGVAPALALYSYWNNELNQGFDEFNSVQNIESFLPYFALLLAAFAGYRLAKFNITEQSNDYFQGLPTPALALASFSIPLAAEQTLFSNELLNHPAFIIAYTVIGGFFLVSNFKLFSLKIGSKNKQLNLVRIAMLVACVVLIVWLHFLGAFLCLIVYLLFSLAAQKII